MTSATTKDQVLLDAFVRGFRATDECVAVFSDFFETDFL